MQHCLVSPVLPHRYNLKDPAVLNKNAGLCQRTSSRDLKTVILQNSFKAQKEEDSFSDHLSMWFCFENSEYILDNFVSVTFRG